MKLSEKIQYLRKDFTINIEIDDVSKENYEFMRVTQCGGEYKLWFETAGGRLYGGNEGIDASLVLDNVLGRGKDEIEKITGTASWDALRDLSNKLGSKLRIIIITQEDSDKIAPILTPYISERIGVALDHDKKVFGRCFSAGRT
jgi:hypothetical protein